MANAAFARRPLQTLLAAAVLGAAAAPAGAFCTPFRRGDVNADGKVDLSDGVATLNFLFLGGAATSCPDAADANADGDIEIADAVFTFTYLFLGGKEPPAPGPTECGENSGEIFLGCDSYPPCGPPVETRDLSDAALFELRRRGGLGFCAELGAVFDAVIARTAPGSYSLEFSILVEGPRGDPRCLPGFLGASEETCALPEPRPGRDLSAGEAAALRELFSTLRVSLEPESICRCIAIDPCLISEFRWDGEAFVDFICGGKRLVPADASRLLALIEDLAAP
jgi:hypothetical protein